MTPAPLPAAPPTLRLPVGERTPAVLELIEKAPIPKDWHDFLKEVTQ